MFSTLNNTHLQGLVCWQSSASEKLPQKDEWRGETASSQFPCPANQRTVARLFTIAEISSPQLVKASALQQRKRSKSRDLTGSCSLSQQDVVNTTSPLSVDRPFSGLCNER